jgi:hypothetical protein
MTREMIISALELQPGDFWTGNYDTETFIVHSTSPINEACTMVKYIAGNAISGFRIRELPLQNHVKIIVHRAH